MNRLDDDPVDRSLDQVADVVLLYLGIVVRIGHACEIPVPSGVYLAVAD